MAGCRVAVPGAVSLWPGVVVWPWPGVVSLCPGAVSLWPGVVVWPWPGVVSLCPGAVSLWPGVVVWPWPCGSLRRCVPLAGCCGGASLRSGASWCRPSPGLGTERSSWIGAGVTGRGAGLASDPLSTGAGVSTCAGATSRGASASAPDGSVVGWWISIGGAVGTGADRGAGIACDVARWVGALLATGAGVALTKVPAAACDGVDA